MMLKKNEEKVDIIRLHYEIKEKKMRKMKKMKTRKMRKNKKKE